VNTLAALGSLPVPLPFAPKRGTPETYTRVRHQARLQLEGRNRGTGVYELLPIAPGHGLARLPPPSPDDMFLDLEGDPFACEGGREYLFGLVAAPVNGAPTYRRRWAYTERDERAAFEMIVDLIVDAWTKNPSMHVYHYAPYEPAALKRLMGRYSSREAEVDRMLRADLFVDLHSVVKHSLRASVERYSIKDLEPFYGFVRSVPLDLSRTSLHVVERALELNAVDAITIDVREAVEGYNKDDCISVLRLQQWLEELRTTLERNGTEGTASGTGAYSGTA